MKNLFFVVILSATQFPLWGQGGLDTLRYSQEQSTLEKQRFIDQYDYVFMTKEPTKWMLKVGYSFGGTLSGQFIQYERKLSPSFSAGLGAYFENDGNAGASGEIRWYYDMKQRIEENKSANNFSGNYWGLFTVYNMSKRDAYFFRPDQTNPIGAKQSFELRWGMQRRFFNHGFADLGVSIGGIVPHKIGYNIPVTLFLNDGIKPNLFFQTNWRMGVAWGDFKRSKNIPTCEVLRCYDVQKNLLKIAWPKITLGFNQLNLNTSFAYEHKIGKSPISINLQTDFFLNRLIYNDIDVRFGTAPNQLERGDLVNSDFKIVNTFEPRFYLHQMRRLSAGKDGLSGWYVAASLSHIYMGNRVKFNNLDKFNVTYNYLRLGPTVGFQQKIFKRGYLDFNLTLFNAIHRFDSNPNSFGWSFNNNLRIGFAF